MRWKAGLWPLLTGGTLLLASACADGREGTPTAPAHSHGELAVTQEFDDREGDIFWNGCTGEYVGFASGSIEHVLVDSRSDGNGGFHVRVHRNGQHYNGPGLTWNGSTWEPTGTQYVGTSVVNYSMNAAPPFPVEYTYTQRVRLIQKGSGSNSFFNLIDHITVNANGDVTADVVHGFITCK